MLKAGCKLDEIDDLDTVEIATIIRADQLRTHDMQWMIRWLASIVLLPHTKKGKTIDPDKLLKLRCDRKSTKSHVAVVRDKIQKAQNIFDLWDRTPAEAWKKTKL